MSDELLYELECIAVKVAGVSKLLDSALVSGLLRCASAVIRNDTFPSFRFRFCSASEKTKTDAFKKGHAVTGRSAF
jgi:hypothetical protein